jgi:hypothetical protein
VNNTNDISKANDIIRSISKQRNDLANQVALLEAAVVARDRLLDQVMAKLKEYEAKDQPELPLSGSGGGNGGDKLVEVGGHGNGALN